MFFFLKVGLVKLFDYFVSFIFRKTSFPFFLPYPYIVLSLFPNLLARVGKNNVSSRRLDCLEMKFSKEVMTGLKLGSENNFSI